MSDDRDHEALSTGGEAPLVYDLLWREVHQDTLNLGKHMALNWPEPQGIIAIGRGGFIPATIIALQQGIKNLRSIGLSSYGDNHVRGEIKVTHKSFGPRYLVNDEYWTAFLEGQRLQGYSKGGGWWIIDDICDSGQTLEWLKVRLPDALYGVVYCKEGKASIPNCIGKMVPANAWLNFPWERKDGQ